MPKAATVLRESGCLTLQPKWGGKLHLKPNSGTRPIANKYHEGKVKSTLERVKETAKPLGGKRMQPNWPSSGSRGRASSGRARRHPCGVVCSAEVSAPLHSRRSGPAKDGGVRGEEDGRVGGAAGPLGSEASLEPSVRQVAGPPRRAVACFTPAAQAWL